MSRGAEHYRNMRAAYMALVDLGVMPPPNPVGWKKGVARTANPEERAALRRFKGMERRRLERWAAGVQPRATGLSAAVQKPWLAEGISRATWYRNRRRAK